MSQINPTIPAAQQVTMCLLSCLTSLCACFQSVAALNLPHSTGGLNQVKLHCACVHPDTYCHSVHAQPLVTPGWASSGDLSMCLVSKHHSKSPGLRNKGTLETVLRNWQLLLKHPFLLNPGVKEILTILGIQEQTACKKTTLDEEAACHEVVSMALALMLLYTIDCPFIEI